MGEIASVMSERREEVQLVRLAGEIDFSNAAKLETDISEAIPNDVAGLVLDLSETHYLDSAGIRMLFELRERLEGRRQSLVAVVPDGSLIRPTLLITAVDQAVDLCDSVDDALAGLRSSRPPGA